MPWPSFTGTPLTSLRSKAAAATTNPETFRYRRPLTASWVLPVICATGVEATWLTPAQLRRVPLASSGAL